MNLFELYAKIGLDDSGFKMGMKDAVKTSDNVAKAVKSLQSPFDGLEKTINAVSHPVETLQAGFNGLKEKTEAIRHPIQALKNKFEESSNAIAKQRAKMQELSNNFNAAKAKVNALNAAYKKSIEETGKTSGATKKLATELTSAKRELLNARNALEKYAKAINDAGKNTKTFTERCQDAQKGAGFIEKGFSTVGKVVGKGLAVATGAITAAGGALLGLEAYTEEYRISQGKLVTAYEESGYTMEDAKGVYRDFYKILGDTGTATEASQIVSKLALSQEDLSNWTKIAAGVNGAWGDSLPIEGLMEASNETARTGQVTGVLADALNWVSKEGETFGVTLKANTEKNKEWNEAVAEATTAEDFFNLALQDCSTEAERNRLIMETLLGEYSDSADAFYRNNEALIANRDAQLTVTDSLAKVGDAVSRVKGELLEKFAPVIEAVSGKLADFINSINIDQVINNVTSAIQNASAWWAQWGPLIIGVATAIGTLYAALKVMSAIGTVTSAVKEAGSVMSALSNVMSAFGGPGAIIAAAIAGVVAAVIYLWNTSESFRGFWTGVWEGIKSVTSNVVSSIIGFFNSLWSILGSLVSLGSSIVESIRSGIASAWDGLVSWFEGIWNSLFGNRDANVNVNINQTVSGRRGSANTSAIAGSHADGLYRVPYDGYIAELHQGERVLTKLEASRYNAAERSTGTQTVRHTFDDLTIRGVNNRDELTAVVNYSVEKIVTDLMRKGVRL